MKLPGEGMSWGTFFKSLKSEYQHDRINDTAGALTYFGLLATFPFILFLVALAGVVIQPEQVEKIVGELGTVAPPAATQILGDQIRNIVQGGNGGLLSIGVLGALWAASSGMVALSRALNVCYDVTESRPFWKVRGVALGLTLVGGLLGLVGTMAMVATPVIANAIGGPVGTVILLARWPIAALAVMFVWALAYWALPDVDQKFKFITPGAVGGVLIWLLASWLFSVYVSNFGKYDATYGALGGVVVLLLWMWISSQVLLLGAEANALLEHASPEGKNPGEKTLESKSERELGRSGERAPAGRSFALPSHASQMARASRHHAILPRAVGAVEQKPRSGWRRLGAFVSAAFFSAWMFHRRREA